MLLTKRNLFMAGGATVLGAALIALPSPPASSQDTADCRLAQAEQKLADRQARTAEQQARWAERLANLEACLAERLAGTQQRIAERLQDRASQAEYRVAMRVAQQQERELQRVTPQVDTDDGPVTMFLGDENTSWLGVESQDVNADKAKELKLPAERGVVLGRIVSDSPAAKAGLKENDVITEVNGQRIEGEAQFRRTIHEIPAGRTADFTVWRDGRSQKITVTLGKSGDRPNTWFQSGPGSYSFQLPNVEIPDVQIFPRTDGGDFGVLMGGRPRLGIDAEDLSGQLGSYFGAPDGEGVLVREVDANSPAEKAGLKSGDVITSVNDQRIRSLGELREKLAANREQKTAKLGVLRNKSEMSLTVELPTPAVKALHPIAHRTSI
jgi:serine protease Do